MQTLVERGGPVRIRLGGNTQEFAFMVDDLGDGRAVSKQKAETTKKETTNNGGTANKKATTVNTTRDHEDMGEARRMPDCRCARCDPCDCDDVRALEHQYFLVFDSCFRSVSLCPLSYVSS